ncbi:uncharacterized protein LOC116116787 [Pistacia vera]|uniref:uncharacterized protein LOC116116787 n=1 Tax=Pistacia vera TaxID=55513 RepID=UPI00126371CF|nr:uncharacterized protein LOC116116787 [Pistacia vera]
MHQDSLRSVVYRSFVTCDDPKGVVECGTFRKSKSSAQKMEHKIKSQKAKKISDASLPFKTEKKEEEMLTKEISEGFHSPSSFQLLEVSRGAQRLNHMIDSWSNGETNQRQSKDVAKDFLKGALDLQDSLMMLGKLQEASQYMAWLKKKQDKSKGVRKEEGGGIERSRSYQFGDRNYQIGFRKPRHSVDGSSRDCYEELREAIRDGLSRQNLLPNTEENRGFVQRNLDSASEMPSTSSSQSSISHTNYYSATDSSSSSKAPEKKTKGPNLIAKLMGLEEIPSNPLKTTLQKQLRNEKISSHQRPMFEIDMPMVRRPRSVDLRKTPQRKTLKEILETQHFTGLLKDNSIKESQSYRDHTSDSHSQQRFADYSSTIVLIKPLRGPFLESEEPFAPMFPEHGVQASKMMPRKLKVREELPSKTIDRKEGSLKPGKTSEKTNAEEKPVKRLSKEEGAKEDKKVAEKPEEKEAKIKLKAPTKMNSTDLVTQQPKKKEAVNKKVDKNNNAVVTGRKIAEKEIVKPKNGSRSQEQAKVTAMKVRKPKNGSNVSKNQIPQQRISTNNDISIHTKQTVNHTSNNRKRNLIKRKKPVSEPIAAKTTKESERSKEDDNRIDFTSEKDPNLIRSNNTSVDQFPAEEEAEAYELQIGENCNSSQSSLSLSDDIPLASDHQVLGEPKFVEEVNDDSSYIRTESRSLKSGTDLEVLLSSNPAFVSHAQELFDLHVNRPTTLLSSAINDFFVTNETLSMDCANELIERRSLPDAKMVNPLFLNWLRNSRISICLNQLLEEVYDGIEALKNYRKVAGEDLPPDSIYAMLKSDLKCKGVESGIWDFGWKNELCSDDIEQVVNDIEKLLLSGLVEEILT